MGTHYLFHYSSLASITDCLYFSERSVESMKNSSCEIGGYDEASASRQLPDQDLTPG